MNSEQKAGWIALIFLAIWVFAIYNLRPLELGFFKFTSIEQYFTVVGLFLAFYLFLKIRREKKTEKTITHGD